MAGVPHESTEAQGEDSHVTVKSKLELRDLLPRKQQTPLADNSRKTMLGNILPAGNKTQLKP